MLPPMNRQMVQTKLPMRPRGTPKTRNKRTTDPADAVSKRCGRIFFAACNKTAAAATNIM